MVFEIHALKDQFIQEIGAVLGLVLRLPYSESVRAWLTFRDDHFYTKLAIN